MILVLAASIRFGAIDFSVSDIIGAFSSLLPGHTEASLDQRIFLALAIPALVSAVFTFMLRGPMKDVKA